MMENDDRYTEVNREIREKEARPLYHHTLTTLDDKINKDKINF
jgi:hypothetical protein